MTKKYIKCNDEKIYADSDGDFELPSGYVSEEELRILGVVIHEDEPVDDLATYREGVWKIGDGLYAYCDFAEAPGRWSVLYGDGSGVIESRYIYTDEYVRRAIRTRGHTRVL